MRIFMEVVNFLKSFAPFFRDGVEGIVDSKDIVVGDIIIVKMGEKVPYTIIEYVKPSN